MGRTLLIIQGYPRAAERIARHWRYYQRAFKDSAAHWNILGINRTHNGSAVDVFPQLDGPEKVWLGEDSYVHGDSLPRLLVDSFKHGLMKTFYDDFCVIENDSIFVRPLPEHPGGLCTTNGAGWAPGFHGSCAWHTPWWADRKTAELIVEYGERMLKANLLERGFPDRFLSLLVDLYKIQVTPAPAFSCNLIDTPEFVAAARWAIGPQNPNPVCYVHGIKTAEQLGAVTKGLFDDSK
jgi:hypothetical protein